MVKTFECIVRETGAIEERVINDTFDAVQVFGGMLRNKAEEYVYMMTLNVKGNPTGVLEVSHGDLSASSIHPRDVYKRALLLNAAGVIVAHNHPSGDPTPSAEDITATQRLIEAGKVLGIQLTDHIIVEPNGGYISIKKREAALWTE